jgi:hypothetical protein
VVDKQWWLGERLAYSPLFGISMPFAGAFGVDGGLHVLLQQDLGPVTPMPETRIRRFMVPGDGCGPLWRTPLAHFPTALVCDMRTGMFFAATSDSVQFIRPPAWLLRWPTPTRSTAPVTRV